MAPTEFRNKTTGIYEATLPIIFTPMITSVMQLICESSDAERFTHTTFVASFSTSSKTNSRSYAGLISYTG